MNCHSLKSIQDICLQISYIQSIEILALKLLYSEIFRGRKISQKIKMKRQRELRKNAITFYAIFTFLNAK